MIYWCLKFCTSHQKDHKILTNRSLLAHLYWVLVHMGRHRVTLPIWTVRKWSGHSQMCSRPPWRIRHRWVQPPLFTAQGLFTVRGRATVGQTIFIQFTTTGQIQARYCSACGQYPYLHQLVEIRNNYFVNKSFMIKGSWTQEILTHQ